MKMKLLDLREKLPADLIEMLRAIASISQELGISCFVIGATARDLILSYGYNIKTQRATKDVDIGVAVSDWSSYEQLRQAFVQSGSFIETRIEQRLIWIGQGRVILDIVPYGAIESPKGQVAFPPDGAFVMTTHGFSEAEKQTIEIMLADDLTVKVVSLAGLGLLKLVSWADRPYERERDVQDLWFILKNYLDAGNEERIFAENSSHLDLLENFDVELTGAKLFGRDVAKLLNDETRRILQKALSEEDMNAGIYRMTAIVSRFTYQLEPDDERIITVWRVFRGELLR
ncbi:MAG TPA: nucleotidyl transferase AbiEii/AbiGii toxin family protein [Pyrinomonadaceae bacterium]|nr:nucleotidyl transferase AbiEii/AbiGii toxin family protein [Pyrinomonadaceae bacterium]